MGATILVVEDDPRQAEVVRRFLEADGHQAHLSTDGASALAAVKRLRPDLVVLDVMLPGLDGLEVCRLLRRESPVPVLMLTARVEEDDLLVGLESGADDYLTKPYAPRELTARVRALLRRFDRAEQPTRPDVLSVGELEVDLRRRQVRLRDRVIVCTPDEFDILSALAAAPGQVFSRQQLLERTRGQARESTPRSIDNHVANLRRKVEDEPNQPTRVVSVYGVGYKLDDRHPSRE